MTHRPRQERAVRTRERILAGAVDVLVENGYAGLTMARVQESANVTRGALTHHFASMSEIAVAAVDYLADAQVQEIQATRTEGDSLDDVVAVIHGVTRRPTFVAGLELWLAARTDHSLREALRPGAHRLLEEIQRVLRPLAVETDPAEFEEFVDGLLSLLRGLAIGGVLRDRPEREQQIVRAWLQGFAPNGGSAPPEDRATANSARSDTPR